MIQLFLSGIELEDFLKKIRSIITEEIQAANQKTKQEAFLSPREVCQLFQPAISKVTLYHWTKQGKLQSYYMGRRVFYKESEVVEALKALKKYKRSY